jgi:hypothetical protein
MSSRCRSASPIAASPLTPGALAWMGYVCAQIQTLTRGARSALTADALRQPVTTSEDQYRCVRCARRALSQPRFGGWFLADAGRTDGATVRQLFKPPSHQLDCTAGERHESAPWTRDLEFHEGPDRSRTGPRRAVQNGTVVRANLAGLSEPVFN